LGRILSPSKNDVFETIQKLGSVTAETVEATQRAQLQLLLICDEERG
jgi:uncharacterized protein YcaQ